MTFTALFKLSWLLLLSLLQAHTLIHIWIYVYMCAHTDRKSSCRYRER